jgi:carboxylesterase
MSDAAHQPILAGCEPWSTNGGRHGVLVLHGFTSCPQSMRPLAEALATQGYTVDLPLLPGHGTSVDDMITTSWKDWSAAAESVYDNLAARCDKVVVAGLSMGGTLTAWLAGRHPEVAGIICVNPLVRVADSVVELVQQMLDGGEDRMPAIGNDIADPTFKETAYDLTPLAPLLSLASGAEELRGILPDVTCPVLLLTSPQDHVVPPADSDELAAAVMGRVERVTLERSFHVATLDHDRDLIVERSLEFVARVTAD